MHRAHAGAGSCSVIFPSLGGSGDTRHRCPWVPAAMMCVPAATGASPQCHPSSKAPHYHGDQAETPFGRMALPAAPARAWGLSSSKNNNAQKTSWFGPKISQMM